MKIEAYCDSSYDEKKKIAGIGIVIKEGEKQRMLSNWIPCGSNNYGELWAVYIASILIGDKGVIYTDSECALAYLDGRINPDRPRTHRQYIEHQNMRVLAYKVNRLHPNVQKVKAHTRQMKFLSIGNAMADLCAKQGKCKYFAQFGR